MEQTNKARKNNQAREQGTNSGGNICIIIHMKGTSYVVGATHGRHPRARSAHSQNCKLTPSDRLKIAKNVTYYKMA